MSNTNHRIIVYAGLNLLSERLLPFVDQCLTEQVGEAWPTVLRPIKVGDIDVYGLSPDPYVLLKLMEFNWDSAFRRSLARVDRSYVVILQDARNRCCHFEDITEDDAFHILHTIECLLASSGLAAVPEVQELKLRVRSKTQRPQPKGRLSGGAESIPAGQSVALAQRPAFLALLEIYGHHRESVVDACAWLLETGGIQVKSNESGYSCRSYANALWNDSKKGWRSNAADQHIVERVRLLLESRRESTHK